MINFSSEFSQDSAFNTHEVTFQMAQGNEKAFELFYERYFARLYRYWMVILHGNETLVQDIIQETMIRVIRYVKPFDREEIFWNWLVRLARSAFIDEMRKKKMDTALLPDDISSIKEEPHILFSLLEEIIHSLPAEDQELIWAQYRDGKSHKTMAGERNTTPKAIESRLARLRQKIRDILVEKLRDE